MHRPIRTVLVANRGEIAMRVLRTVNAMGLRGALVYHAADRDAPAVAAADLAIQINGATPVGAYLNVEEILRAAEQAQADAIHPGYGFLSENAAFARRVAQAGLAFIGPSPEAIELMGDKVRARSFVESRGFPVAPSAIEDDAPASFVARARKVGFPLLIKPAAGGGGKGMRIVREAAALESEIARARSEGERYFGDGRLYVERYVERPRHIEVQVLGDAHGNVVHLWERECSVQRRFQKIIEETPSPALDPDRRRQICAAAAGIAHAAGYRNAGTVEFIYAEDGSFYFLEMNTRLQVEHPVTEMVTGLDLVEQQIRVAMGERLSLAQGEVGRHGHAIELRIYAEEPARNFTPATGRIVRLRLPQGEGIRMDCGVREGQAVTAAFDPMLAKLIAYGADREQAIARVRLALARLVLLGCPTNASFLDRLIAHPAFARGEIHTGFLDAHPELAADSPIEPDARLALLAATALSHPQVLETAYAVPEPLASIGGWRN
ncbi:MAG TPA: biotin carboxylase N-terminal domain-containing protein [Candidatus Binataceae bacterium]|nr:biotin carboxylase N-terminal domain-containing protein [Candidatus Binataceae bacterium]